MTSKEIKEYIRYKILAEDEDGRPDIDIDGLVDVLSEFEDRLRELERVKNEQTNH